MITQAELKELFDYREDGSLIWKKITSFRVRVGDKAGSPSTYGYLVTSINNKAYKIHRLIWCIHHGNFPNSNIDHINGITNDNRIENLRDANSFQNACNTKKHKHNTSGIKGVSWEKRRNRFEVYIQTGGKKHHLGYRFTLLDAAALIIIKRKEMHGEFARFE